jgi:hypothetical protein
MTTPPQSGRLIDALVEHLSGELRRGLETMVARLHGDPAPLAAAGQPADALAAVVTTTRAGERESMLAGLERLLTATQQLDESQSLREALDRLGVAVAAEAERTMLFVVRDAHLHGWTLSGFGAAAPPARALTVTLEACEELRQAVEGRAPVQVHPDAFGRETSPALAFARLPRSRVGLAVPVTVGTDVVAILYADDGANESRPVPGGWPEAVELLARHASRCLETLTIRRAAERARTWSGPVMTAAGAADQQASGAIAPARRYNDPEAARRYARLLVSEMKLFNEAAIRVGRDKRDLRSRLRAEIDRARRLYEERVSPALEGRDALFDDEIVRTLAGGNPELLGAEAKEPV